MLDNDFTIIHGPCSLDRTSSLREQLHLFKSQYVRAGLFKLRTDQKSFQGLREEGIPIIEALKVSHSFSFVTEVVSIDSVNKLSEITDYFQVGTRNMYNYELLKKLNDTGKKIILKRAFSATLDEWIKASEYIDDPVNRVILCERGIRTFEPSYRNTIDLNAVSYLKEYTNYKVLVDPTHGTGRCELIMPMSKAALACGADGLLVETHQNSAVALSDNDQALNFNGFKQLIDELERLAPHFNKKVIY